MQPPGRLGGGGGGRARAAALQAEVFARSAPLRTALVRRQLFFPDRRLIQYDCGKLQARAA